MKAVPLFAIACVALLGAGAQNVAPVADPRAPSVRAPHLAIVDDTFAVAASRGDAADIDAAKIALARSSTDGVVAYARLMLTDHDEIAGEGAPLIRRHLSGLRAPLSASDALAMEYLRSLPSVDFDQQYAMLQVGDHLATSIAFATEARDGRDPALVAFAKKWLPTIQTHLQLALTLAKHVAGDTPFKH